jgi:hypothetical protein
VSFRGLPAPGRVPHSFALFADEWDYVWSIEELRDLLTENQQIAAPTDETRILKFAQKHERSYLARATPIVVVAAYGRFRANFSDLAAATDSKKSDSFWAIVTLIWTIIMVALYFTFYRHGRAPWKSY